MSVLTAIQEILSEISSFPVVTIALKIAICSLPGITHISDKISRSCKQLIWTIYSINIMHYVKLSNIKANILYLHS